MKSRAAPQSDSGFQGTDTGLNSYGLDQIVHRLQQVQIDDAIEAARAFMMLMGDEVQLRRAFI